MNIKDKLLKIIKISFYNSMYNSNISYLIYNYRGNDGG